MVEENNNNNNSNNNPTQEVVVTINEESKKIDDHNDNQQQQQQEQEHEQEQQQQQQQEPQQEQIETKRGSNPKRVNRRLPPVKLRTTLGLSLLATHLLTFFVSFPLLYKGIWLFYIQPYDCEDLLESLRVLQLSIATGLVCGFMLSIDVILCNAYRCLQALGFLIGIFALVFMAVVGFTLRGSYNGAIERQIPGSPGWLEKNVLRDENWNNIKSCLRESNVCRDLVSRSQSFDTYYDFTAATKLSPVEWGCCYPPAVCEMELVQTHMSYGRKSNSSNMDYNGNRNAEDCKLWQNNERIWCYRCDACKLGFAKLLQDKWTSIGEFLVVMSFVLMASHILLMFVRTWRAVTPSNNVP